MDFLDADALRRLFPEAFWQPFIEQGSRPDGRPSGQSRPASIGLGAVANAASSALVKLGNTAVLAATQLEIMQPSQENPNEGRIEVLFGMPPVCSPHVQAGRTGEEVQIIGHQLRNILCKGPCINLKELCIVPGSSAWVVYLDLCCIDADGSVFDAALLAALAALQSLELPGLQRNRDGSLLADESEEGGEGAQVGAGEDRSGDAAAAAEQDDEKQKGRRKGGKSRGKAALAAKRRKPMLFGSVPIAQTISLHGNDLLVDPTAEEERLWGGNNGLTVVFDAASLAAESPRLHGVFKAGGPTPASLVNLHDCIAVAKLNCHEKHEALLDATQDLEE